MRIGILTFHRAHNYGAVLQCYALQQYLMGLGHDAFVIDYNKKELWEGYNWRDRYYESLIRRISLKMPIRLFRYVKRKRKPFLRYRKFQNFQEHILRLSPVESILKDPYDLILIGSDQVWNTEITHGFDPYYWGAFDHPATTKIATYAASLRAIWKKEDHDKVFRYLKNLDGISVRENATKEYLHDIFPQLNVSFVPDPVLLLSPSQWEEIAVKPKVKKPYAFFYQAEAQDRIYEIARKIAEDNGLRILTLSADVNSVNSIECHTASPQEFLGWILNANLVITSSFHGLAFSILFQKDFYAINLNLGKDSRLSNLIRYFKLENRLIDDETQCVPLVPFCNEQGSNELKGAAINYINELLSK